MFTRELGQSVVDNPLLDSPFVQQGNVGSGSAPVGDLWILLSGDHFSTLEGPDFEFLG